MSRVEPRGQFLPDRRKQDLLLRLEVPHPPGQQKSPAASTQLIVRRLKGEQFSPSPKDRTLSWQFRPWPGVTTAKRAMIRPQWSYWHECEPRTAQQRTGAKQWRAGGGWINRGCQWPQRRLGHVGHRQACSPSSTFVEGMLAQHIAGHLATA